MVLRQKDQSILQTVNSRNTSEYLIKESKTWIRLEPAIVCSANILF